MTYVGPRNGASLTYVGPRNGASLTYVGPWNWASLTYVGPRNAISYKAFKWATFLIGEFTVDLNILNIFWKILYSFLTYLFKTFACVFFWKKTFGF